MKRIAIPIVNEKLCEYMDKCSNYEIFEIDGVTIKSTELIIFPYNNLTKIPEWLARQGITDIIVYKLNKRLLTHFADNKINLFIGVPIDSPRNLIEDYLNGNLKSNNEIISEITS